MKNIKNTLNEKLLEIIHEQFPDKEDVAPGLSNILALGKQAIYRRLRGDTPFTFEEAVKVLLNFGISLDNLIQNSRLNENKWAFIDTDMIYSTSKIIEQYKSNLFKYIHIYFNKEEAKKQYIRIASNVIPYLLFMSRHEKLFLFRFYKWIYLTKETKSDFRFSNLSAMSDLKDVEKQFAEYFASSPRILLILDRNAFLSIVNDILYFFNRKLISEEELLQLKKELFEVISYLEDIAMTGKLESGSEVIIYLCDVQIDSTCMNLERESQSWAFYWAHIIDPFVFNNSTICQKQKQWIESLKRYSTLITQTGEVERSNFFREQRNIVKKLDQTRSF